MPWLDRATAEGAQLITGKEQHAAGGLCEAFEHATCLLAYGCRRIPSATQSHATVRHPNDTNNVTSASAMPIAIKRGSGGGSLVPYHCSTFMRPSVAPVRPLKIPTSEIGRIIARRCSVGRSR